MSKINRKIPVFIFLILACIPFLLPGCSGKELITEKQIVTYYDVFEDENENWKARYVLNEIHVFIKTNRKTHYYGEERNLFSVTCKGNLSEFPSHEQVKIYYNAGYDAGSWERKRVGDHTNRNLLDGFVNEEHVLMSSTERDWIEEQKPIFEHTIGPVCAPYNTIYIHNEDSGGVKVGKNDTVRVTIELDGETEVLELKSA